MKGKERQINDKLAKLVDKNLLSSIILSDVFKEDKDGLAEDLNTYLSVKFLPILLSDVPVFAYPSPEEANGDYMLGYVSNQGRTYPFCLREGEMIKHLIFLGASGSGKSNLVFLVVKQLLRNAKPFLIIDWKRNYRDLHAFPETTEYDVLVFTVGRDKCPFHFNALIPPAGTSPHVWLAKIIEIISHAYFLGEGVMYLLSKAIDTVYKEFDVYQGSDRWPTFRNVLSFLENYESKGRETQWLASALRAVATLCFGELDRILNTGNYPIDQLLSRNVILEVDALTDSAKIFLTEALLLWIHHHRMAEGKREEWKHTTIIEEAHHILSRKLQMISGTETITDIILREIREFGESLIIIDQDPSLLSVPALGNTYTTICLNLKAGNDVNVMRPILNLSFEDKDFLSKLEVGQAIVKLQGRWTDPFLIQIPEVNITKGSVTDENIKTRMAKFYDDLERSKTETTSVGESRPKTSGIKEEEKQEEKRKIEAGTTKNQDEQRRDNIQEILEELKGERKGLLVDVYLNQLSQTQVRYARLGLNKYQGNKVQHALLEKGLIEPLRLPSFEKRGYWGKTFQLTELGRAVLGAMGYPVLDTQTLRRGSLHHMHIVKLILEKLQRDGHQVIVEAPLGEGKTTDLIVDGRVAVEVERSLDNTVTNVKKNLVHGLDVIVACSVEVSKQQAEKLLREAGLLDRVTVVDVAELLKNPMRIGCGER